MLKPSASEPVLSTPESTPAATKAGKKRRRVSAAKAPAVRTAAPMAGVDAFGRVVNWTLFNTTTRNERQAHQTDRTQQAQASERSKQNAELAAEAERARTLYHTAGLTRVQACRDGVETIYNAKEDVARAAQARADAQVRREAAGLARAQGSAQPGIGDGDSDAASEASDDDGSSSLGGASGGSL